eukprot:GFUD01025816.1.p1 GENE.GFUD01025816.1~~GFUD01025816.1.p1  ORF type:complete len:490 (+),score=57.14 GFUD01025816.1:40-1509(+)
MLESDLVTCTRKKISKMGGWNLRNSYYLALMTVAHVLGEIAHFLINASAREVARDLQFGELACFFNASSSDQTVLDNNNCSEIPSKDVCENIGSCSWDYSGLGIEYQILAGPAFVAIFSFSSVLLAVFSDQHKHSIPRTVILGAGTAVLSSACLLMSCVDSYWQLVVLRMFIAVGESVCRPLCGALIANIFSPGSRGVANGIFFWGVYVGFGLAFLLSLNTAQVGLEWRTTYILVAVPGFIVSILFLFSLDDPIPSEESANSVSEKEINITKMGESLANPILWILLLGAIARQTAGLAWAYNTELYFQNYYPNLDFGYWIFSASVVGGCFGVFAGGFLSDRLASEFGFSSRLMFLAGCTLISGPLATGTLYFNPPEAMVCLFLYYFFAETWFGSLFTVIVELVDPEVQATVIALFLFFMNQIGGNLPIIVTPLHIWLHDYRFALCLVWPGFLALSSLLFLFSAAPLYWKQLMQRNSEEDEQVLVIEQIE